MSKTDDLKVLQEKIADAERQQRELSLKKLEIAKIQIDSAIRCYLANYSRIAVSTLIFPAFQIVRDLNKGRKGSIAQAFTEVFQEAGISPGTFWKEVNKTAATIKHANEGNIEVDVSSFCKDIEGAIFFSIHEYANLNENRISVSMTVFVESLMKSKKRKLNRFEKRYHFLKLLVAENLGRVRHRKSLIIVRTLAKVVEKLEDGRSRKQALTSGENTKLNNNE